MAAPTGYGYYKQITVQDANIAGNETDFPTLIQVVDDSDIGGNIVDDTNGYDIRFYDVNTDAELKFERTYFDVTAGDCNATFYVKCALYASPAGNQNLLRLYYGKAADSDGQDAANTWDANYIGVWHMNDASGTIVDSTGNSHDSSAETITAYRQAGKIRYSVSMNGSADYITINDHADFTVDEFTMEGWFYQDADTHLAYLWEKKDLTTNDGWSTFVAPSANDYLATNIIVNNSTATAITDNGEQPITAWGHLAIVQNGAGVTNAYYDGVAAADSNTQDGQKDSTDPLYIGRKRTAGGYWDGDTEEVRFSNTNRSANWLAFQYANVNEIDNELTWAAETAVGGSPYTIECTAGTYAVTGATLNPLYDRIMSCTTGTYAVTGSTLNALFNRKAICTAGTYAITGATLNPLFNRRATCTAGVYAVTGAQLEPVYQENVTIGASVFEVEMVFKAASIGLGAAGYGDQVHMFMSLSMN